MKYLCEKVTVTTNIILRFDRTLLTQYKGSHWAQAEQNMKYLLNKLQALALLCSPLRSSFSVRLIWWPNLSLPSLYQHGVKPHLNHALKNASQQACFCVGFSLFLILYFIPLNCTWNFGAVYGKGENWSDRFRFSFLNQHGLCLVLACL